MKLTVLKSADTSPWIVIEYAENGALKGFVKKHGENRHSNQLLNYCRDIVRGMKYLSERGYIHRVSYLISS